MDKAAEVQQLVDAAQRALDNARVNRPDLVDYYTDRRNEWKSLAAQFASES